MYILAILLPLLTLTSASPIDKRVVSLKQIKVPGTERCLAFKDNAMTTADCGVGGEEGKNGRWYANFDGGEEGGRISLQSQLMKYITPSDVKGTDKVIKLGDFVNDNQKWGFSPEKRIILQINKPEKDIVLKPECLSLVKDGDKDVIKTRDCGEGLEAPDVPVKQAWDFV